MLERIVYDGALPASFFSLVLPLYAQLPFAPDEDEALIRQLFDLEAPQHTIVIYTDHQNVRLAGIFPHNGEVAYFGFWETVFDQQLTAEVFDLAIADAARFGKNSIVGPLHFNTYHRYRLRLGPAPSWQQFDREPVNPEYYPQLLQRAGFKVKMGFQSRLLRAETVPRVYQEKQPVLAKLPQVPFDFVPLNPESWKILAGEIYELIHQIFSQNPAYKPVSRTQFDLLYNAKYAAKLCPHTAVAFRDKGSGKLAAISLCHPNYHGLNLPAGETPSFGRDYPRLPRKTLLSKTLGVHPAFRQQGIMDLLAAYGMLQFQQYYEEIIFCLMRNDNYSLRFTDHLPVETAHYALFEKEIAE